VTLPALRVSGDYFVVTSFGIQLLATAVFTNWTAGTGGAKPRPVWNRRSNPWLCAELFPCSEFPSIGSRQD
jgi:ABC-type branched-subunit amino acid transport system permease subunit